MRRHRGRKAKPGRKPVVPAEEAEPIQMTGDVVAHTDTSPALTGGDMDADWRGASATGEEAVGGSVATPDQDVVDAIGRALGVERREEAEVTTSEEILRARDRRRWDVEAEAAAEDETSRTKGEG
jgi:hypothetical protein